MLVRGQDDYGHFESDKPATSDLDPAAIAHQAFLEDRYVKIAGNHYTEKSSQKRPSLTDMAT